MPVSVHKLHGFTFQKTVFFTDTVVLGQHTEQSGWQGCGKMQAMRENISVIKYDLGMRREGRKQKAEDLPQRKLWAT